MAFCTWRNASSVIGRGGYISAFEHALWNESGEFSNFFVDVVSPSSLDSIVALSSSSSFFVCDEGLFVVGGESRGGDSG